MRQRIARALLSVLLVVSLGAAQGPTQPGLKEMQLATSPRILGHSRSEAYAGKHQPYQVGTASWYGSYFEGRPTASGEPFDMYDLTAAHPSLPLGSWVKVTNLRNGRRIYVRINDRGPVVEGRIIDLSYRAAEILQFKDQGLQRVRLDLVSAEEAQPRQIAMLQREAE
ncbi:MAG TPA: septal ring lytic transglycosylase RlpA family protein [Terriglobales bacterium]|nr:septal ring lytic transglycosylase RlpA family protein [Terriglobales bacterium]